MREERKATITDLYLKAYTNSEIGKEVGSHGDTVNEEVSRISTELVKSVKVQFSEDAWQPPIYNVWTFAKSNKRPGLHRVLIPIIRLPSFCR